LSHSFDSRYASKLIKGSKDVDHSLASKKTLSQKWLIVLAPRARWIWPKARKHLPSWRYPRKLQTQNRKCFFFQSALEDLLNP